MKSATPFEKFHQFSIDEDEALTDELDEDGIGNNTFDEELDIEYDENSKQNFCQRNPLFQRLNKNRKATVYLSAIIILIFILFIAFLTFIILFTTTHSNNPQNSSNSTTNGNENLWKTIQYTIHFSNSSSLLNRSRFIENFNNQLNLLTNFNFNSTNGFENSFFSYDINLNGPENCNTKNINFTVEIDVLNASGANSSLILSQFGESFEESLSFPFDPSSLYPSVQSISLRLFFFI